MGIDGILRDKLALMNFTDKIGVGNSQRLHTNLLHNFIYYKP